EFSNRVTVVDYKTGKPKTRNDVMGNTKTSNGDYYRQLVFYKLLLSRFADGQYRMDGGVIDFVEPDDKGKLHREAFEISDEEVETLIETIQDVIHEIITLSFWDTECDEKTCDYCDLVKGIKEYQ